MTVCAIYDTETNGLLMEKRERDGSLHPPMDHHHLITIIETDGKYNELARYCGCDDRDYQPPEGWTKLSLVAAVERLQRADVRIAHNEIGFDHDGLLISYPWYKPKPGSFELDSLVWSRLIFQDIARYGPNSSKLYGWQRNSHGLKEWGIRLGEFKGEYKGGWLQFNPEMGDYGCQDTVVLLKLVRYLAAQKPAPQASNIEHGFARIIQRQTLRGVVFNMDKALVLQAALQARETELETQLIEEFGEWWEYGKSANSSAGSAKDAASFEEDEDADDEEEQELRRKQWEVRQEWGAVMIPLKSRKVKQPQFPDVTRPRYNAAGKPLKPYVGPPLCEYTQGHPYTPIKRVQFNPSSRTHIRKRLIAKYGWEPIKFTKGGKKSPPQPVVDDDVLQGLPYPEAKRLAEYYLVLKRIGQLATGKKAWIKVAKEYPQPNGRSIWRIHGRVNPCGALGGRCTHSDPNLAQVPKNSSGTREYPDQWYLHGGACRELFEAGPGYVLVGFDGSSLEYCMLAHFVFPWDKGEFARRVDAGRKEDASDPHSWLRDLIGQESIGEGDRGRDHAKTVGYADLYGCGDEKRGAIVIPHATKAQKIALGKLIKERMDTGFTAKADLKKRLATIVEANGSIKGLDGRTIPIRKIHAALNTLLQSAGAVVMKQALILLDKALQSLGLRPGEDYEFVLNIHDEAQAEVRPQFVDAFKEAAVNAVVEAGRTLNLHCPLKAEPSSGTTWRETH